MPRGGFRKGAGRPRTNTKVVSIRLSDEAFKIYAKQKSKGRFISELIVSYQARILLEDESSSN